MLRCTPLLLAFSNASRQPLKTHSDTKWPPLCEVTAIGHTVMSAPNRAPADRLLNRSLFAQPFALSC